MKSIVKDIFKILRKRFAHNLFNFFQKFMFFIVKLEAVFIYCINFTHSYSFNNLVRKINSQGSIIDETDIN